MNNMTDKTLDVFEEMPLEPNHFLYVTMHHACALLFNQQARSVGKKVLHDMLQK